MQRKESFRIMRFFYAFIAFLIWILAGDAILQAVNVPISNDIQFLSVAIVVAGALAGGD